ncbi:unnamed protein product, partial [Phaeothamnion confervicola]
AGATVAVTGASGFLGRHLVARLRSCQATVLPLDRSHGVDLLDPTSLSAALRNSSPTHVFHLAASLHRGGTRQEACQNFSVNVNGTHNLLAMLSELNLHPTCVLAGTADVYGSGPAPFAESQALSPISSYAASKLA